MGRKKLTAESATRICSVPNCGRPLYSSVFCQTHFKRLRKHGSLVGREFISNIGEHNPNWKGGQIGDGHGRVLIYSPNHPNPSRGECHVYRYRLVMERYLGRYLRTNEIVHHKNGIVDDDRIENLEVMSQSDHIKTHWQEMNSKQPKYGWSKKFDACLKCGKSDRKHFGKGMCCRCYKRSKKCIQLTH